MATLSEGDRWRAGCGCVYEVVPVGVFGDRFGMHRSLFRDCPKACSPMIHVDESELARLVDSGWKREGT